MSSTVWNPGEGDLVANAENAQLIQAFVAVAGQTVFTLTLFDYTINTQSIRVYRNGVKLQQSEIVEISGTQFSLPALTLEAGEIIECAGILGSVDAVVDAALRAEAAADRAETAANTVEIHEETYVATEGQTVFTLVAAYAPGSNGMQVGINGLDQSDESAFTETDSHTITLLEGAAEGDVVEFRWVSQAENIASSSEYVTYLPAGTGAVATNVQSKLRELVSVKDFGAVGDGIADDAAAFQAATTYSPVQAVFVPSSNYVISGTVTGKFYSLGAVTILDGVVTTITNLVP